MVQETRRQSPADSPLDTDPEIARIITLARAHLGMDVAFISEFARGKQVYQAADGDAASFGIELDDGPALEETYCRLLVAGVIPCVVGDTAANSHVADLEVTTGKRIGAYVGVPLTFSDGELYGTFCCLSHDPDTGLSERDGKFMGMLADILADRLEYIVGCRRRRERLVEAIEHRDFAIALQPVVSLLSGSLVGVEALSRFSDGLGTADAVFREADELGIGPRLEAAAFQESRRLAALLPDDVYLAMNVSPAALVDGSMAAPLDQVEDPAKCVLELTERVSVDGYIPLLETIAPLRARGFRLAVDDVGAGYASFHHVLELRPDIIKIDRSLVAGSSRDGARRRIITSIVLLALDLGAAVVAEGVEEHDDLQAVTDLGVDSVQGYLLARPTADRSAIAQWATGWVLDAPDEQQTQAARRIAFGRVLRDLRGSRRQVEVLQAVNEHLAAAGESARISQGQYSAYENGRERPQPVRIGAIEAVFGLEPGTLASMIHRDDDADRARPPGEPEGEVSLAARLAQGRRKAPPRSSRRPAAH